MGKSSDTVYLAKLKTRFWANVDKRGPKECWPWTGTLHVVERRAVISVRSRVTKASFLALDYAGHPRPPAPANHALHSCDNPACVNPAHLRWGTHADNMQDRATRQRDPDTRGENNGRCLITAEDVKMIRASSLSNVEWAARLGVGRSAISNIRTNRTWRHVA